MEAQRETTVKRPEKTASAGFEADDLALYAPRKMTLAENLVLTIKVLTGFGLLGLALWGISLWKAAS